MSIGERIKIARASRHWSQEDLGQAIGKGQTTISSWERGRTEPTREEVARVAAVLRLPVSDIEGASDLTSPRHRVREVPLISWVSAGEIKNTGDVLALASNNNTLPMADLPDGDYFATVVRGDSMDRISPEGSRIIVNTADRRLASGSCYLFSLRGEATYKRYFANPVIRFEPYSTNPANQIIFPKADKDWAVIGRVVRSVLDLP